jgi:hypothetical protein
MPFSDALDARLLNSAFGASTFTPDATIYLGVSSTDPGKNGATQTEPSGGSYARVTSTNNTTNWPTVSAGPKLNGTLIQFPQASADWLSGATIGWVTVWNSPTLTAAANFLGRGQFTPAQAILTGNRLEFAVGQLAISAG